MAAQSSNPLSNVFRDDRKYIVKEFEHVSSGEKQRALRFLLLKMGPQSDGERTLWRNFAQVEKDYPAMADMLHSGRSYPLQGEFNDAREGVALEFLSKDQSALRAILEKMGPQSDDRKAWQEFEKTEKNYPQLYYNLWLGGDSQTLSWHAFESKYSARIQRGDSIFDLMKEHRKSRMTGNAEGMYATARIEAALRMTKGDTKKAASFLASM